MKFSYSMRFNLNNGILTGKEEKEWYNKPLLMVLQNNAGFQA